MTIDPMQRNVEEDHIDRTDPPKPPAPVLPQAPCLKQAPRKSLDLSDDKIAQHNVSAIGRSSISSIVNVRVNFY